MCPVSRNCDTSAVPFHSTTEPGEKLLPMTMRLNTVSPACFITGVIDLSAGFGNLICCWQAGITRRTRIRNQELEPNFRRKSLTPESYGPASIVGAIVETTKDVLCGQLGCFRVLFPGESKSGGYALHSRSACFSACGRFFNMDFGRARVLLSLRGNEFSRHCFRP